MDRSLQSVYLGAILSQMVQLWLVLLWKHPFRIISTSILSLRPKVKSRGKEELILLYNK